MVDIVRRTVAGSRRGPCPKSAGSALGCGSRFSALLAHQSRMPASNSSVTGSPSQAYSRRTSPTGSAAMAREVDVEEPVSAPARRNLTARSHALRPMPDIELAQIAPVEVIGEPADDVGVHIGDRQQHVGGIAVGHHEAGIGENGVEVVQRQHVRGRLQPPRPRRFAPGQQFEHAALVGVGGGEVGPLDEPPGVAGDLREGLEDLRLEVERHQIQTLHRAVHVDGNVSSAARQHLAPRRPECADRRRRRWTAAGTAARTPSCAGSGRRDPGRAGSTTRWTRCGAIPARTAVPSRDSRRSRGGGGTSPRPADAGARWPTMRG